MSNGPGEKQPALTHIMMEERWACDGLGRTVRNTATLLRILSNGILSALLPTQEQQKQTNKKSWFF